MFESLKNYLSETLGIATKCWPWGHENQLPHAIGAAYQFAETTILGERVVLLNLKHPDTFSVSQVAKHVLWVEERFDISVVLTMEGLESYNRKRLIEQKVAFIIPGNQMYLPTLGLDLRDHIRRLKEKGTYLTPSAQVLLLTHLLNDFLKNGSTATALACRFGFTKMTMGRAIDELEAHCMIETRSERRERQITFPKSKNEIWTASVSLMRTPVRKTLHIEYNHPIFQELKKEGLFAGFSALSQQSMLAETESPTIALGGSEWKTIERNPVVRMVPKPSKDLVDTITLQIWKYDPRMLSTGPTVDPLSLYLSLKDDPDERVESALETLLKERVSWLRD